MNFRRRQLCEGGPRQCNEANEVVCTSCGTLWAPPDIRMPDGCPECGEKRKYIRQRCAGCEVSKLELAMTGEHGRKLFHLFDLDSMLQCPGFAITPNDIDAEEWAGLRILWSERVRFEEDERKRVEMEARMREAGARAGKGISQR